jgi:hypothetical protein
MYHVCILESANDLQGLADRRGTLDQDEIPVSEEKHSVATSYGGTYETIVDLTVGNAGGQFAEHSIEWSHIVH